jgi:glycine cleavage system aminomethyltransferase T
MAYLPAARAQPGSAIEIDVRGRRRRARVEPRPLLKV